MNESAKCARRGDCNNPQSEQNHENLSQAFLSSIPLVLMAGLKQRRSGWSGWTDLRNGALAVLRNKMVDECNQLICSLVHTFHYPSEPPIKVNAPRRWRLAVVQKANQAGSMIPLDSKCPDHTQFECVASRRAGRTRNIQNIGGGWRHNQNGSFQ